MQEFLSLLQLMFSGVAQGMIYSLVAFGYNITFATSRTFNFSLGNFVMLGGVVGFVLYMTLGIPFFAAILGVMLAGVIAGTLLHKIAIEPSMKIRSAHAWILATLAVGIVLKNAVEVFWSTDDFKFSSPLGDDPLRFFESGGQRIGVYPQEILIIVVSLLIVGMVELFLRKTIFGKAIIAVSEDRDTASLMGINQGFVILFSFLLSSIIALIAGVLVSPITLVSATMGTVLGVKAYAVSIIGGLESGYGVLIGGLLIGVAEALTSRFISTGYKDMAGFILLILILYLKPAGLFGRGSVQKL